MRRRGWSWLQAFLSGIVLSLVLVSPAEAHLGHTIGQTSWWRANAPLLLLAAAALIIGALIIGLVRENRGHNLTEAEQPHPVGDDDQ
jgi:hypothetical protein